MIVVRTNAAREAARVAAQEEAACAVARAVEEAAAVAAQEEAVRAVVRAKELVEKAATDAMEREEMSWDKAR
jgi:hypothetical protein